MNKLPSEIISKIMLYNRSKEAEIFLEEINKAEKKYIKYMINTYPYQFNGKVTWIENRYYLFKKLCCNNPETKIFGAFRLRTGWWADSNSIYMGENVLINANGKSITIADIKKICIENGLTRKSFKNKKQWASYLYKNI